MLEYAEIQSDFLVASGISGFVFRRILQRRGLERVKVYRGDNPQAVRDGAGLFARSSPRYTPTFNVIEEGRLTDALQAEHFLAKCTSSTSDKQLAKKVGLLPKIMKFHAEHKLFLLSRAPDSKRDARKNHR